MTSPRNLVVISPKAQRSLIHSAVILIIGVIIILIANTNTTTVLLVVTTTASFVVITALRLRGVQRRKIANAGFRA